MSTTSEQQESSELSSKQNKRTLLLRIATFILLPVLPFCVFCLLQSVDQKSSFLEQVRIGTSTIEAIRFVIVTQLDSLMVAFWIVNRAFKYSARLWLHLFLIVCVLAHTLIGAFLMHSRGLGAFDRLFFLIPWHEWVAN